VPVTLRCIATGGTRTENGGVPPIGGSDTESMTNPSGRCSWSRVSAARTRGALPPSLLARRTLTTIGHAVPVGRHAESAFAGSFALAATSGSVTSKMTRNASVASRAMSKGHEGD
jgi:hypothetical protein